MSSIPALSRRSRDETAKRQPKIPATKYFFPQEDIEFVLAEFREVLESGAYLTQGRHVLAFEAAFAQAHGVDHCVATNAGTSALECIFHALELEGAEVIVPTNTFAATAYAVLHAGAIPVFADIGPDMCVDPEEVAPLITSRTRAIVTVHIGGLVSPGVARLKEICDAHGLHLVEDAAQAHGASFDGQMAGSIGVAGAFSFFSTKLLAMGEGGAITTNDAALAERMRLVRNQGKLRDENYHEIFGYNWRMTEIEALLGLAQLRRMETFIANRARIARWYDAALAGVRGLTIRGVPDGCVGNFYKYIAFAETPEARAELKDRCRRDANVTFGGDVYGMPLHMQPVFRPWAKGPLPVAEDLCPRHVCPPIHSQMTRAEARQVTDAIRAALA